MSKRTPGLYRRPKAGRQEWHIDKWINHHGRLCESTGTDDEEEAQRYLEKRVREIREAVVFGVRRKRTFREAATKYLTDYAHKPSIGRSALALKDMDPFIGDKWLDSVHGESFKPYIEARRSSGAPSKHRPRKRKPLSMSTLNRNIGVARRVLRLAAMAWREVDSNLTWLAAAPLIQLESDPTARKAYPLDWDEQQLLFSELAPHLQRMALFDVNTGLRDQELCSLQWSWEQRVPELDTPEIKRSVFVLPATSVKNRQARAVIVNDVAQSVLEEVRGEHPVYVFTWENRRRQRHRVGHFRNSGWIQARRRAAARYAPELGKEAPAGFKNVRVHDLRHTFGRRLRAAGVSFEDRQDLLGHRSTRVTTDYSAAELRNLLNAANRLKKSRKNPAMTVLRLTG
jgi:integrase